MITVMGATGHTGKKITEALLKAGEKVRALGRSESKLGDLKQAGAEVLTGDASDAEFLTRAFLGVEAVYTLLPTDPSSPNYRAEQTRIIGEHIGKPDLQYVQFSYADEAMALVQAGMSQSFAELYVEMTRAFNEGKVKPGKGRNDENTTPTRFEDFAGELAKAYEAMCERG